MGEILNIKGEKIQRNDFESIMADLVDVFRSGSQGKMFIVEKHQDKVYIIDENENVSCIVKGIDPYDGLKLATANNQIPKFIHALQLAMKSVKQNDSVLYGEILAVLQ